MDSPSDLEKHLGWIISGLSVISGLLTTAWIRMTGRIDRAETRIDRVEDQTIENKTNVRHIEGILHEIRDASQNRHTEYMAQFNRLYDKIEKGRG